ncbi:MAG: type IX secretion system outer membrane channel protein PorV [Bacteroidales bacterium]|nr:type IX secretion system outer membrane channel protein PorV [Bacteroidales bacterium]
MQAFLKKISVLFAVMFLFSAPIKLMAQDNNLNTVTTAVPFLMISPDSRGGALGDAGVATSPDVNSLHWNPAKYAFAESEMAFSLSYSPWLRDLVDDIGMAYVTGYKRIDDQQAIAASLRYFSLGNIQFTNQEGTNIGEYSPNEFSLSATYSRKLGDRFSGAVSARFINSNLTQGQTVGGQETTAGTSFATDVAVYYQNDVRLNRLDGEFAWGINISNIGAKIAYTRGAEEKDFLPTNLRFGPRLTLELDDYNEMSFMFDVNKLLVPSPPIYKTDSVGMPVYDEQGDPVIEEGMDPDVSVVGGMIQSFHDAPGGFSEEMREYNFSVGMEYWYDQQFALRGGFFYEDASKGNRQYFTLGAGLRYNVFGLDFSYLIPTDQRNPLSNTLRFSLSFDFEAFERQNR